MFDHRTDFEAIGTKWSIDTGAISEPVWQAVINKIRVRIAEFDKCYSRFRSDSLVTAMSKKAGDYQMPADGYKLFNFYEKLYKSTEGMVTPLIGQAVSDAGYDARYSLTSKPMTAPPKWEDVIYYSEDKITLSQPALLDFGAAGKGYLVDIVGDLLKKSGVSEFVVNAGGDMLHHSQTGSSVSVGLENPLDVSQAIGIAKIKNQSLCASSASRRYWGKFNHMLNPRTLESPKEVLATWVMAPSSMAADGLATALFFCESGVLDEFDFSYAILRQDMSLQKSKNFNAKIFEVTK